MDWELYDRDPRNERVKVNIFSLEKEFFRSF